MLARNEPSVVGFVAFAKTQPADKRYVYFDYTRCACAQYAKFIGEDDWMNKKMLGDPIWQELDSYSLLAEPRTWGGVVEYIHSYGD